MWLGFRIIALFVVAQVLGCCDSDSWIDSVIAHAEFECRRPHRTPPHPIPPHPTHPISTRAYIQRVLQICMWSCSGFSSRSGLEFAWLRGEGSGLRPGKGLVARDLSEKCQTGFSDLFHRPRKCRSPPCPKQRRTRLTFFRARGRKAQRG